MIDYLSLIFSVGIAIVGIVRYKKLTMPFRLLSISFTFSLLLSLVNIYVNSKFHHNSIIAHIDSISNYLFYSAVYYLLFKEKFTKYLIVLSIAAITVFFFINGFLLQPFLSKFPTNLNLPTEIFYVVFALLLYKQMLLYPVQVNIIKQSTFWYNTGILFFASTMFVNLQLVNYYSTHKYMSVIIYFWYSINIIFDIMMGIAILADNKEVLASNEQ